MSSGFVVFGNPIKHSKSPEIYSLFEKEIGFSNKYGLKLTYHQDFDKVLFDFFESGGLGANVTVPFKDRAFYVCDHLTDRAILANAVNTIKKQHDGTLLGDNTDGIGFISDLKYLNWLDKNNRIIDIYSRCTNANFINIKPGMMSNILVIGAGGAAKGIISELLKIKECYVNVVNRTFINAQKLVRYYHSIGKQNISCMNLDRLFHKSIKNKKYDLIINATSSSMVGEIPSIPSSLIGSFTKCYDIFYQKKDTSFLKWCKDQGSGFCSDGLGMLIQQAAYSFYLWHNIFPSVNFVLKRFSSVFRQ